MVDNTQAPQQGATQITEDGIQQAMFSKIGQNEQHIITRVYLAGMTLLFHPKTHNQFLAEFEQQLKQQNQQHDVGSILGTDIAHIMMVLLGESKNTMPKGALIPAGTLLLAKVTEFCNTTGVVPVSAEDYAQAVHLMSTVLQAKFDPQYAKHVSGATQQQPDMGTTTPNTGMLQGA